MIKILKKYNYFRIYLNFNTIKKEYYIIIDYFKLTI
jgi:hypothetical protein